MKKLFFILASILLWTSCSNQDEPGNQAPEAAESQTASRYLSPSEAVKRASEAYENMFGKGSRSTLSGQAYLYNASTGSRSFGTDSVLYVVNFDEGGFAVVPAYRYDDTEAYAIGEHSTFDASQNPAAEEYVDNLASYASLIRDSLRVPRPDPEIHYLLPWKDGIPEGWHRDSSDPQYWFHDVREVIDYDKYVVTNWHQQDPYNRYCPMIVNKDGERVHGYAGCVAIAIAQICSYYRTPSHNISGYTLDWDKILAFPMALGWDEATDQIAHLVREIGIKAKLSYNRDNTSGSAENCLNTVRSLGFPTAKYDRSFDNCMDYISTTGPCIVLGVNNKSTGHAWIIDGIKISRNNQYRAHYLTISDEKPYSIDEKYLIHCNWGWGGYCDGYFLYKTIEYASADISYTGDEMWTYKSYDLNADSTYYRNSTLNFLINLK